MASRYVEISKDQMDSVLIADCGFQIVPTAGTWEYVYQRQVSTRGGQKFQMAVKVLSSVDLNSNRTRPMGEDSIKVMLMNMARPEFPQGLPISTKHWPQATQRLFRTKNALPSLKLACQTMFRTGIAIACPLCMGPLLPRKSQKGPFYGCSTFPVCWGTKPGGSITVG